MGFFARLFGPASVTIDGQTYSSKQGYQIQRRVLPGEGRRPGDNRYVHDIPIEVTTVTDAQGRVVKRTEQRLD